MYQKLTPLKQTDHGHLRLLPIIDYSFARGELVAPIVIDEIADVAREYPIVFPVGSGLPVALMGVETDANAYVGIDGQWLATYVPAHIRHYPMAITRVPAQAAQGEGRAQEEGRFVVLIDEASAILSQSEGQPLFAEDGKLAPAAEQLTRLMEQIQARSGVTQRLVQAIDAAGLLVERAIRIKREGELDRQVTGIRVIDEAALNKLDDAAFNSLRKSGALPLVYASLLSWANFRQGPIGKSHPLPLPSGMLDDDVIRFN
jgi:hypothetical protein